MLRKATSAWLVTLLLAAPSAALAQGAGDDQYQDPFGTQPTQSQEGADGGLSQEPPGGGDSGSGDSGSGDGGSGDGGSGSGGSGSGGDSGGSGSGSGGDREGSPGSGAEANDQLPNTGSEVFTLAGLGVVLLLAGTGLRLRTIDPDAF